MTKDELLARLKKGGINEAHAKQIADGIDPDTLTRLDDAAGGQLIDEYQRQRMVSPNTTGRVAPKVDVKKVIAAAPAIAAQARAASTVRNATTAAGKSDETADQDAQSARLLVEAQQTPANARTPEQQERINRYLQQNPGQSENSIADLAAGKLAAGNEAELKDRLMQQLGVDEAGLDAIQRAAAARMGSDLPYSVMFNLARGDQEFLKIADETKAKRNGYAVGSYNAYTDPFTGKQVMVRAGTDEALRTKIPGFGDYGRAATRTVVDSSERFAGKMGFENIYGLFAYTLGVFDANQEPTITDWSETDDAEAVWNSNAASGRAADPGSVRRNFARNQLQKMGKMPPRFLPDGTLNPVYQPRTGGQIPTSADSVSFTSIYQDMWNNPEKYVDDDFWTTNDAAYKQALWDAKNATDSDAAMMSDLKRERMYEELKPKLDAYLAEFGDENSLAAIVAVHNADLGRKMARGLELTDEDLYNASLVFGGLDPADVGIVRDGLGRYQMRSEANKAAKGPTIIQPDREKITQGMQELYRSMFHADPNGDELGALVEQIAGQYISSQYSKTDFDPQAAATAALRGTDIYSQLYGNRPSGMSDADYSAQFERTGQAMLGGMQAPGAAIQAGLRNNDANLTAAVINADKKSWENSSFLEQFYRSMNIANEMT